MTLKPCYQLVADPSQRDPDNGIYNNENENCRLDLAFHSLDSIERNIGLTNPIVCGLIHVAADVNEKLSARAKKYISL